ncbi:MAG: YnfA family protein [Nitrospirae bacterium]|nr:YnfA family protein [Nitrospirota bacterium]
MSIPSSLGLFVLAGLCEIGGGYLVWQWLREGRSLSFGLIGGIILMIYGVIPTFQDAHFGRVYAAYGGMFILLSLLWGWAMDGTTPDRFDVMGGLLCLAGVAVIMYVPRP